MPDNEQPPLRVVPLRFHNSTPSEPGEAPVDAYAASGAYELFNGRATVTEPSFPEELRSAEPTDNLGIIGGEIADIVAEGGERASRCSSSGAIARTCRGLWRVAAGARR